MVKKFTLTILLLCAFCATFAANYLTFTAEEDSSSFERNILRCEDSDKEIQYSLDNGQTWQFLPQGTTIILQKKGDKALLRRKFLKKSRQVSHSYQPFRKSIKLHIPTDEPYFIMTGRIAASGSVMSLVDGTGETDVIPFDYYFVSFFAHCTSLTQAPELPAKKLTKACYWEMFWGCENLVKAPELPAKKLAEYCYEGMFTLCTNLKQAPELPAKKLAECCYEGMFTLCTNLTQAPQLPAKKLADECYAEMFSDCNSLTQAPELPATQLAKKCYAYMFAYSKSLVQAPQLPATKLVDECYKSMFEGCTSLTHAPELPATHLAKKCYAYMFAYSKSLVQAPQLPATKLMEECYMSMFEGCTSLTHAPELPATHLQDGYYINMFKGCTKLSEIRVHFSDWGNPYAVYFCDFGNIRKEVFQNTDHWLDGVSPNGKFISPEELPKEFGKNRIPAGWTIIKS